MVQSTEARLLLIEKELLQLQLHLCAGNGTFQKKKNKTVSSQEVSRSLFSDQHVKKMLCVNRNRQDGKVKILIKKNKTKHYRLKNGPFISSKSLFKDQCVRIWTEHWQGNSFIF